MPVIKYPRNFFAGGRLTASSGNPVYDVTNASTLYYTPYLHGLVSLYDGVAWNTHSFSELTLGSSLSYQTIYDIFLYNNAGTLTLQAEPWTGNARNVALVRQDGVWVKTGYLNYLFLGSVYADGSLYLQDHSLQRFIWNQYNQVLRKLKVADATNSWTYTTASYRSWNNSDTNRVEVVLGQPEATISGIFFGQAVSSSLPPAVGIGVDSTSANSGDIQTAGSTLNGYTHPTCRYFGSPGGGVSLSANARTRRYGLYVLRR